MFQISLLLKMAPLIDESCSSSNYNMDVDNMSLSSTSTHSEDVEQVIAMAATKVPSAFPLYTTITKKYVRFADETTTHLVLSRVDYTVDEMSATWYDRTDLKQMRSTAKSEARLLEAGMLQETETTSARGLEGRTTEGLTRKRRNRTDAVNAVFDELDQQDEQGIFDDDALADVYFVYTEHCQVTAQMIGMRDAKLAKGANEEATVKSDLYDPTIPVLPNNIVSSLSTAESLISSAA